MNNTDIEKIKKTIAELVYDKVKLRKAYNYYHCTRDAEQFRHLEDNFGIGTPTSINFTPLIKKHIDVLIGEYLGLEPDLKISCKDSKTVSNIMREKQLKINETVYKYLKSYLQNSIIPILLDNRELANNDPFIQAELDKLIADTEESFTSEYEIAAQNILIYLRQSRNIDLKNKMRELFLDLLITGTCYYRVIPTENGENVSLEILNPLNTFIERNTNSYYLKDSYRAVIRKYMTKEEIINRYHDELTSEALESLDNDFHKNQAYFNSVFVRVPAANTEIRTDTGTILEGTSTGILGGLEVTPMLPFDETINGHRLLNTIPVYEVEWLEVNKKTGYLTRHEGVKIGNDIYITRGESKYVVRSSDYPSKCTLSVNGTFFLDKNGQPFSLILATSDLQDKYDMLLFYRDNLIASSGTVGEWLDLANVPEALGVEMPERIQKWLAWKKNGVAILDSSQEGQSLNTIFNGFDDTVKVQAIQAIQLAIQSVEQQASSITGVFQEKLGQIEQRDAVSNVQVGIKQSTLLTKQYFDAMDLMYKEVNYDMLNLAKIVFKKGLRGTIILGDKYAKLFTALPEHYTITDFDIHIEDSTRTYRDMEALKSVSPELIKAGLADSELVVNIFKAKNMNDLERYITRSMKSKKLENDQLMQLQQRIQQYEAQIQENQRQLEQLSSENKKLLNQIDKNSKEKLDLERKRISLEEQKIRDNKDYNDRVIDTKEKQIQVEQMQLYDSNPYNNKIKTNV